MPIYFIGSLSLTLSWENKGAQLDWSGDIPKPRGLDLNSKLSERFIYNPDHALSLSDKDIKVLNNFEGSQVDIYELPKDVFTQRFSLVFNTFWHATLAPLYTTGNLPANYSELGSILPIKIPTDNWWLPINETFAARESVATTATFQKQYTCSKLWLSILVASASILLLSTIIATILKWRCIGPDLFGYVSTLVIDNPYIPLPPGGCTLDGVERTQLLANMKIGLVDVSGDKNVGHIAFSALSGPHSYRKLQRGRAYMGN